MELADLRSRTTDQSEDLHRKMTSTKQRGNQETNSLVAFQYKMIVAYISFILDFRTFDKNRHDFKDIHLHGSFSSSPLALA